MIRLHLQCGRRIMQGNPCAARILLAPHMHPRVSSLAAQSAAIHLIAARDCSLKVTGRFAPHPKTTARHECGGRWFLLVTFLYLVRK